LLSNAIDGFVTFKLAEATVHNTIFGYKHDLRALLEYISDQDVSRITVDRLRNLRMCLSSMFVWLSKELGGDNPMTHITAPKFKRAPV
jgi:hypothetical protein